MSRGFVYVRESEKLLDDARDQVRDVLGRMSAADKRDFGSVKTRIRETVSRLFVPQDKAQPHDSAHFDGGMRRAAAAAPEKRGDTA